MSDFREETNERIRANASNVQLNADAQKLLVSSIAAKYSYNFSWQGRPIIQYPQDMVAMQELIWKVKPDLIIETGIAHGGSIVMSAAMLAQLDYCEAVDAGVKLDPKATRRRVIALDIDIRPHNKAAIEAHPMAHFIEMIEGSSIDLGIVKRVQALARSYKKVLVFLDSNHTHDHVLAELEAYAPLTSPGSYCCVFDTVVEDLPDDSYPDRPWSRGNNPKTAVWEYLDMLKSKPASAADGAPLNFEIDQAIQDKLLITVAPDGYLKRV